MTTKSAWAYKNGQRIMRESKVQGSGNGWIKRGDIFMYAEKPKNCTSIVVKTYANRTQAEKMAVKLKELGSVCWVSAMWPFKICKK